MMFSHHIASALGGFKAVGIPKMGKAGERRCSPEAKVEFAWLWNEGQQLTGIHFEI